MGKTNRKKEYRRVAVTGLGVITSTGGNVSEFKEGLFEGRCGIGPISLFDTADFPCRQAAQINNDDIASLRNFSDIKRTSRCDLLGLIAAREAVHVSGIKCNGHERNRIGVVMGGGAGGMRSWEQYRRSLWLNEKRQKRSLILPFSTSTLTDLVGSKYGFTGARATLTTACSSSTTSIGYGFDLIKTGAQDVVVTGGSESLCELTFAGFNSLRVMDPEYCRPFDRNRNGLSLGEGAAVIVLEDYVKAEKRGAAIYAEVLGYAINADAYHMTSPDPEAIGMGNVMASALKNANVQPGMINYINAHGTATKANDMSEVKAVKRVFGEQAKAMPVISSTKSMVGHCLGASGAIEAAATILAIYEQTAPPTIHYQEPDPDCDMDCVPNNARKMDIDIAMSNSFAFGGNNSSIVFKKYS